MYWSRTGSVLDLAAWGLLGALWWAGGWLLAMHVFRLRRRESLLAGLALGLVLFILLGNLLGQFLPLSAAFWAAGALILASGAFSAGRAAGQAPGWRDELQAWPQLLSLGGLILVFALINRGLAIFDDYHNLPLLSVIAAGDLPPHFYLNSTARLAYHYGLHLFAASLMRVGGFYPWSAFDLSKAISLALATCLAWLWFRRATRSLAAGILGGLLAVFGGGARWLLLLLPIPWLVSWGAGLTLLGSASASGPDLYTVLASPWKIEGGGPLPFPFALANGVNPPMLLSIGGPGALPQVAAGLLLLLAQRRWRLPAALLYGLILGSLALAAEHLFGMIWAGLLLAALLMWRSHPAPENRAGWSLILISSALLALVQGGVITEIARGLLGAAASTESAGFAVAGFAGFGLRWPPALLSAHLGSLALTNPAQLLIALAEIGPLVLLLPWVVLSAGRGLRRGRWIEAGLACGSFCGILLPLFLRYGVERDISRLTGSALYLWLLLGLPSLWFALRRGSHFFQALVGLGYASALLGGLALFSLELIAIPRPQFTYFVDAADASLSRSYWDRLEEGSQVLDLNLPYRAVTLFGRHAGHAYQDIYTPLPEWEALMPNAEPGSLARAGYAYIYIDKNAWQSLDSEQRAAFQAPCARKIGESITDDNDFRWLLDIRACK